MASKFHVRSNSFPSGSHPISTRVEEELNKLRTWESTSASTSGSIVTGLSLLEDLYLSLDDLLNLASTQKVISHHQGEECLEELLDGSLKVLDICGITRDTIMQIKENIQTLHSALRRRKGDSSIETSVAEYNLFSKKMKNVRKLITSLKQMDGKFEMSPLLNQNQELVALVRVLREVIMMNMSIFQSLLTFLAGPASKSKATKWMAKLMHKRVTSSDQENSNEFLSVDATLSTLLNEGANGSKMQVAHERLEALENVTESFDISLENLFRRLIKTRASLLNTMAQ